MLYGSLTRILTQKESQKAIHSCLYNKCHKTLSSFIFHSPNQNLDDFIGSIHVELNLYKDVFIRLQIEITEYAELQVFFIYLLEMGSSWNFPARASPSCESSEPIQAELGHFNFRAEIEITYLNLCSIKII